MKSHTLTLTSDQMFYLKIYLRIMADDSPQEYLDLRDTLLAHIKTAKTAKAGAQVKDS